MKKILLVGTALGFLAILGAPQKTEARTYFNLQLGGPTYVGPQPYYVAPQPYYVEPYPYYVEPYYVTPRYVPHYYYSGPHRYYRY